MRLLWIVDDSCRQDLPAQYARLLRDYPGATLTILALDPDAAQVLAHQAISCKTFTDYVLPTSQGYGAAAAGMRMLEEMDSLILPGGRTIRSLTLHSGISLWDLHRVDLLLYGFERIVKQAALAGAILEAERPDRILCAAATEPLATLNGLQFDRLLCRFVLAMAAAKSIPSAARGVTGRLVSRLAGFSLPLLSILKTFLNRLRHRQRLRPAPSGPVDVMALNHTVRNAEALIPVLKLLGREERWRSLVLQIGPQGEDDLRRAGLAYSRWEKYLTLRGSLRAVAATFRLFRGWRYFRSAVKASLSLQRVFKFGGVNLWEIAEDGLQFLWMTLAQGVRNLEIAKRTIQLQQPRLLVGTNERSGTFRAFYEVGRICGIPSLCIHHAIINPHPMWRVPIATDVMAVEGQAAVDNLARVGCLSRSLAVTGQPKYDDLLSRSPAQAREMVFRQYGIPPGSRLVVYASHATREVRWKRGKVLGSEDAAYAREAHAVYEAVSRMDSCYLVVKPHPQNDDPSLHQELLRKVAARNIFIAAADSNVYSLILACDLLITRWSQTGVDALVSGKALVIVNLTGQPDPIPYVDHGAALGAHSEKEVEPAIDRALNDPAAGASLAQGRQKFLAYHTLSLDGNASGRVARVVDAMIEDHVTAMPGGHGEDQAGRECRA